MNITDKLDLACELRHTCRVPLTIAEYQSVIETTLFIIREHLKAGHKIELRGFGSFMNIEKTEIDQRLPVCTCRKWAYGGRDPSILHHPKCFKYNYEYENFLRTFLRVQTQIDIDKRITSKILKALKKLRLKIWPKHYAENKSEQAS